MLLASVADVQHWRDSILEETKAPKTLNRHISSLSSFYKYLAGAAELRLPINVPNPPTPRLNLRLTARWSEFAFVHSHSV